MRASLLVVVLAGSALAQTSALRVGAAKVDITPAQSELPKNYEGVHDHIHSRAIVIDNGGSSAALISVDAGSMPDPIWQAVTKQLESELGIPTKNVMLTATHTHSVPGQAAGPYAAKIVESVRLAKQRLAPARVGYGTGVSYINVNRNIIDPKTRRWWEGPNYEGPSDKTVAVVRFETLAGAPIAVYYNYAVHPVITGNLDMISADIPGAASNYLEESMGGNAVAVWSSGASGDQNPIFFNQTYELRDIRIKDYAARGQDISNAMPPGGEGLDRSNPRVQLLLEQQKKVNNALGLMLAEEVLHVMRGRLQRPLAAVSIDGAMKTVTCPGRKRLDEGRAGFAGSYEDADPVPLKLSMLRIGDVTIGGVDAEVFNPIAQRFKRESSEKDTMMVTLTDGMAPSGYIPNDAAYGQYTFEVLSSRLKPGCAEDAIVNGLLDLQEEVSGE